MVKATWARRAIFYSSVSLGGNKKPSPNLNSSSVCSGLFFGRVLKMRSLRWSRVRLHEVNVTKSGNRSGP